MKGGRGYNRMVKKGFTIVELLIVIVVIAILAAITIVAYNGIQNRAKESAAQVAASQAGKKMLAYGPQNGDQFPLESTFVTDLALSPETDQAKYDYYVSDDRKKFCLSVTNPTFSPAMSYAMSSTSGGVVKGKCVKNLASNPSVEMSTAGWSNYTGFNNPVTRASTTPAHGSWRLSVTGNNSTNNPRLVTSVPAATGEQFSISYKVRSDGQAASLGSLVYKLNNGSSEVSTFGSNDSPWSPDGAGWVTGSGTSPALPSGGDTLRVNVGVRAAATYAGTVGIDSLIVIKGTQIPTYADGDSAGWSWVGESGLSPSFGPMILN